MGEADITGDKNRTLAVEDCDRHPM